MWGKIGKFVITPQNVVEGRPEDLKELGDDGKYAGWVYVDVKHVSGTAWTASASPTASATASRPS